MTKKTNNLNLFSDKLTLELRDILSLAFGAEQNNVDLQEIGRHIAQFVFLKEAYTNRKGEKYGI